AGYSMGSVAMIVPRDGPLYLLLGALTMLVFEVSATSLCSKPELPPGTYLVGFVGDKVSYRCGKERLDALCVNREWILPTSKCLKELRLADVPNRLRRSTGVYTLVSRRRRARSGRRRGSRRSGPHIALDSPPLVVVRAGEDASMMCRVENLGSHSITWSRVSDNKVIAIDTNVLVGDPRVTAKFEESLGSILQVGHTRTEDQGEFECQVSTRPPLRHIVDLQVLSKGGELKLPQELPTTVSDQYEYLLRNLSALWKEVGLMRTEIQHHLHAGSTDQEYNKAIDDIEVMHHENVVHNHHRPHHHHNLHHNPELLQHMIAEHGHHHTHQDEGEDHREHNHHHDHQQDMHDHHGLHEHEHDHDDFNSQEDLVIYHSFENDDHYDTNDHDHDIRGSHGGQDLQPGWINQESDEDDDDSEETGSRSNSRQNSRVQNNRQQNTHNHRGHGHEHGVHHEHDDGMMVARCDLQPNKDMPTSNVRGSIIISQRKDKKGPVYFDLDLEGFNVQRDGYIHGFHIHAQPVTRENKCGAAKGHFNPFNVNHGGPSAQTRHVGDLGNIRVDEDGELEGYILSDKLVAFDGENSIIRKSIVVCIFEKILIQRYSQLVLLVVAWHAAIFIYSQRLASESKDKMCLRIQ
ncbi:unnamed protein product, partial [Meganyctiphanes norvegica]